jgi:hypothetical protein
MTPDPINIALDALNAIYNQPQWARKIALYAIAEIEAADTRVPTTTNTFPKKTEAQIKNKAVH